MRWLLMSEVLLYPEACHNYLLEDSLGGGGLQEAPFCGPIGFLGWLETVEAFDAYRGTLLMKKRPPPLEPF